MTKYKIYLYPPVPDDPEIQALREKARKLQDAYNEQVRAIWHIKLALLKKPSEKEVQRLTKKEKALTKALEKKHSLEKLNDLLDEIKAKEIALCGYSSVGGSSPYNL
jgi:hypothetical protein